MKDNIFEVKIKSLTPIWTGDENGGNTTLRETGIIGSLRWWYEALIRGLGGTACDPTNTKCNKKNHCDACELFGCTGWARKFRLDVEKVNDYITLRFIKLRDVKDVERGLLNKTLNIIADYGAIGGRIAEYRYGLIEIESNDLNNFTLNKREIENYLKRKGNRFDKPNISMFVFINNDLKYEIVENMKNNLLFLKGTHEKAKKYFYKICNDKPYCFFAYAENDSEYKQILQLLNNTNVLFVKGTDLLEGLK
jgi:CRISPR-associated protein Cmr1